MTNFKDSISQIKQRISCVDYARRCGLQIGRAGDRCASPLRQGAKNKTSFWVFEDHWYDWGSGVGGDVIDLAAALNHNGDKGKAIRELAEITGVSTSNYNSQEWVNYTQNLNNEIQHYHERLTAEDREYLYKRRISDETINRLKIGRTDDNRLCFPYWKNGYICYYATRHLDYDPNSASPNSKYKKMQITDESMNEHTVWGLHSIERNADRDLLVIAEGAFDAMSFEQEGYSTISAITGFFSKDQLPTALAIAKMFKKVFLVYDNDFRTKAGEKFTLKMTKILTENRIPCVVGSVPEMYKDISEYYAAGGNLDNIVSAAKDGVEFLASKITDRDEFEAFARKVCRYMTKPSVDLFFHNASPSFPQDWLKTLCKDCKSPPNDDLIAKEIIARHRILYNPKVSFFQYNGKFWEAKTDHAIEKYISVALGSYATGPRLSSVLRLIKAQTETTQLFNTPTIVNFINGTLELDPEVKFREHRETDYCTYCLDYPYIPETYSPEWSKFLATVTNNDEKKMCLLQELSGYVLFPDNRLQKCAVLIGSGANGKSVFLNVLTKIFGSVNVSNVEMSSLSQDFQAIQLMNAMLNVSAETRTNVNGAESRFKQVVAGDEISACYKGKDYITFRPRAKMFLACNEYVKSTDTTEGWTRRFCFVDFPMKFVEQPNPSRPFELPIDRNIESRLSEQSELTKIFNWVLDGYIMLRKCGYFSEPDDQQAIAEEFKELSNPLLEFAKELHIDIPTTNQQLYNKYKDWCDDAGHNPLARNTFSKRFAMAVAEYRDDIEPYRTCKERGYKPADPQLSVTDMYYRHKTVTE